MPALETKQEKDDLRWLWRSEFVDIHSANPLVYKISAAGSLALQLDEEEREAA